MSSATSRDHILARLYNAKKYGSDAYVPEKKKWNIPSKTQEECRSEFREHMSAVRTEVYEVDGDGWVGELHELFVKRNIPSMLYAPSTPVGEAVEKLWPKDSPCKLLTWESDVEEYKNELFEAGAAVTTTIGAVAEPSAVILWPTKEEPRLLSIVPPVHVVIVEADKIHSSFQEAINTLGWNKNMPTNALLISGPSKTADIELILQFGVHGPTDLIVYVVR